MRITILGLMGCLIGAPVWAQERPIEAEEATQLAGQIDEELAKMRTDLDAVRRGYAASLTREVNRLDRRLREGEIHYILGDYLRAAIVLLDVVEDESLKQRPGYDEALFLHAESLRHLRNYAGAKTHLEDLMARTSGDRLKDVVMGLLQIAGDTNHFEDVERYIARLRQAGSLSRPDVDYIYGKMVFRSAGGDASKLMRAHEVFKGIPAGSAVSGPAAYYAGVCLVQMGRYEEAVLQFQTTLDRASTAADAQELRELTFLALGRLYQEIGDVSKSADAYQEVAQTSPRFSDMLYELAWAHVGDASRAKVEADQKAALQRALRASELLMATSPDSTLFPQASILQGNLQIRLGATETAYDSFSAIVDRYGADRDRLRQLLAASTNPREFFEQLLADDLKQVDPARILPPLAITWAVEEPQMEQVVEVERDLKGGARDLVEGKTLVETLLIALAGEQRFNMFPGLRPARIKALSVENRVLNEKRRLLWIERRAILPRLAEPDRVRVDDIHAQARLIEEELARLPKDDAQVDKGREEIRAAYQAKGQQLHRLSMRVASMRAQLVAVDAWLRANAEKLSVEEEEVTRQRIEASRNDVLAMEQEVESIAAEIKRGQELGTSDGGYSRSKALAAQYQAIVEQELALLRGYRAQAAGDMQGILARLDQQRAAIAGVEQEMRGLQNNLESQVRLEVDELRRIVAAEGQKLDQYSAEQMALSGEANTLVGPVAQSALAAVGERFNDLVLKADVGIIDVAWAKKQAETLKVNALIREQQDRTQELENEFADVLKE